MLQNAALKKKKITFFTGQANANRKNPVCCSCFALWLASRGLQLFFRCRYILLSQRCPAAWQLQGAKFINRRASWISSASWCGCLVLLALVQRRLQSTSGRCCQRRLIGPCSRRLRHKLFLVVAAAVGHVVLCWQLVVHTVRVLATATPWLSYCYGILFARGIFPLCFATGCVHFLCVFTKTTRILLRLVPVSEFGAGVSYLFARASCCFGLHARLHSSSWAMSLSLANAYFPARSKRKIVFSCLPTPGLCTSPYARRVCSCTALAVSSPQCQGKTYSWCSTDTT